MKQPTLKGRKLPRNDWQGNDNVPGSRGKYVTCMDTSVGRAVAYATNGRIDLDGAVYRAAVIPPAKAGITFRQAARALKTLTGLRLVVPVGWTQQRVEKALLQGQGLIVCGDYQTIPRAYRHQVLANFNHAIWISHLSRTNGSMRVWDPLNPNTKRYGRWIPQEHVWPFIKSLKYLVGYVPLQKL